MKSSTTHSFNREQRYLVLKASDVIATGLSTTELDQLEAICKKVDDYRRNSGKSDLETVVVEKDWPEYEPTWTAIELRVIGTPQIEGNEHVRHLGFRPR